MSDLVPIMMAQLPVMHPEALVSMFQVLFTLGFTSFQSLKRAPIAANKVKQYQFQEPFQQQQLQLQGQSVSAVCCCSEWSVLL